MFLHWTFALRHSFVIRISSFVIGSDLFFNHARFLAATVVLVRAVGGRRPGADDAECRTRLDQGVVARARRRASLILDGVDDAEPQPGGRIAPALCVAV